MTLAELNDEPWYRLIKVIYVFLYLPYFLVVFLAYNSGREYHEYYGPDRIEATLNDPGFYKLGDDAKRHVLSAIDKQFNGLVHSEQTKFIRSIKEIDIRAKEIHVAESGDQLASKNASENTNKPRKDYKTMTDNELISEYLTLLYRRPIILVDKKNDSLTNEIHNNTYVPYYTQNIGQSIINSSIATLCYVLFMEIIRRIFYYVVIGKVFPQE
jgi:hypothetical protein